LKGRCPCGTEHAPADPKPRASKSKLGTIETVYRYETAEGATAFEVVRYRPKNFRQRQILDGGRYDWNLNGVRLVPYRLPALLAADPSRVVMIAEGEKDADALVARGFVATCSAMGAGKWKDHYAEHLVGRHVAILPHNDKPGRDHAQQVALSLEGKAASVKIVELPDLPEHGDVWDYFARGETATALERLVESAPSWSPPAEPPATSGMASPDRRPVIGITTEEHAVIDQAVGAIAADPTVFRRGFVLVTVQRDSGPSQGIIRPTGSPRISVLPLPTLRERLTKQARWAKLRATSQGDTEAVPAHPPDWAVSGVASRGEWPSIRPLEAVIEAPVIRLDGSILDVPGYDPETGLLYEPNAKFIAVKDKPSVRDARAAAVELLDLVVDFPFAGPAHRASWLAATLTPFARFAIDGPCPLFLFDAPASGSGKTLLCDTIAYLRTGREIARKDYPDCNVEMRKAITAIALAADPIVLLDNVASTFGGSALDAMLTARTWKDRLLGVSQMSPELPLITVWFATGNNVTLRGDIMRRIVPCRLEPDVENPEERTDFKYPRLMQHVRAQRPQLVSNVLTVLRAFIAAGRPDQGLKPLGSYEAWSDLVRSAVVDDVPTVVGSDGGPAGIRS
jgi:hypothetical protein